MVDALTRKCNIEVKKNKINRVEIFNMSHDFCDLYIDKHFIIINTKVGLNLEMQDGDTLSNMRNI